MAVTFVKVGVYAEESGCGSLTLAIASKHTFRIQEVTRQTRPSIEAP